MIPQPRLKVSVQFVLPLGKRIQDQSRVHSPLPNIGRSPKIRSEAHVSRLSAKDLDPDLPVREISLPAARGRGDFDLALGAGDDPADADVVDGGLRRAEVDSGQGAALQAALDEDVIRGGLGVRGNGDCGSVCGIDWHVVVVCFED